MFDVGFSELLLIALVGLLVFGPERLPGLFRDVSRVVRKTRSALDSAKSEISHEFQLHELRSSLEEKKRELEQGVGDLSEKHPADWLPQAPRKEDDQEDKSDPPLLH